MGAGPGILGRLRPTLLYSLIAALSWPVVRWLYRLRAEGAENLPAEGGYVLAANHISNLDPWPL
jgi:1-acyl-sn-glycerol-3-phosphate acyltransferase